MKTTVRLTLIALAVAACTSIVGDTPTQTGSGTSDGNGGESTSSTGSASGRECVRVTGGTSPVNTGSTAGDALFLSGEIFVCADDVVVVGTQNLNEVAAAAQLAAAVGGPLLFPEPTLASELGRLKPRRVFVVGEVSVNAPPEADVETLSISDAVELAKETLQVDSEVRLPATPDATTIIETVNAIVDRDRVVFPQTSPSQTTDPTPVAVDESTVVAGLATPNAAEAIWLVDAGQPVAILMASATGRTVGAATVAYDSGDILGYPEVGTAIAGRPQGSLRYVGAVPSASDWELALLASGHQLPGGGFMIFPDEQKRRYVAFYGHPDGPPLGALGEQGPAETLQRMTPLVEAYSGDGSQVIPTFEMIVSVASAQITDGDYSFEWPISEYEPWIEFARENDMYVILDLQPGRDDFLNQAMQYEELLKLPFVGLALDPEWRLGPNQVHLEQVGRVDAAEVNLVVDWLADLVRDNGLPQKMLIVHQFRAFMIENREILKERPELQMVLQMDGDGTEDQKDATYAALTQGTEDDHWRWGWKNFFDEDEPGPPAPESTMGKDPSPVYVSYQ